MRHTIKEAATALSELTDYLKEGGELLYPLDTGKSIGTSRVKVPMLDWVPVKILFYKIFIDEKGEDDFDEFSRVEVILNSPNGELETWMVDARDAELYRLSDIISGPTGWKKVNYPEPEEEDEVPPIQEKKGGTFTLRDITK